MAALRRILDLRPPATRVSRPLTRGPASSLAVVAMTSEPEPGLAASALGRLLPLDALAGIVLLPMPSRRQHPGSRPRLVAAMARHATGKARTTIALPRDAPAREVDRWRGLASECGAEFTVLGTSGWDRILLGERSAVLDEVYIPAELSSADALIAFTSVTDDSRALGFWRGVVHPHSRLRASVGNRRIAAGVDLATPFRARYMVDLTDDRAAQSLSGLAWTDDPIAAELVALGLRYLRDRAAGIEAPGPWEDAGVQVAVECGLGVAGGQQLILRMLLGDHRAERLAVRLAEALDCQTERIDEEA